MSWSLKTIIGAVLFILEAEPTLFLRMHTKHSESVFSKRDLFSEASKYPFFCTITEEIYQKINLTVYNVINSGTAYITQLKKQKFKKCFNFGARWHYGDMLQKS